MHDSRNDMTVHTAMLRDPAVHPSTVSIGELRKFFASRHVHMALLVREGRLVATVERDDLDSPSPDEAPASTVGSLRGRVIGPDVPLTDLRKLLTQTGRRRLAVVDRDGALLGLLCLKKSGSGFCSEQDVIDHRNDVRAHAAA